MKTTPMQERRIELGLTQAELAKKARTDQAAISRYERGAQFPNRKMATKLAKLLGLTEQQILFP